MALSKEDILSAIAEMSVMDVVELVEAMEKKFGVTAASAAVVMAPSSAGNAPVVEEKTEFDVVMTSFGSNKVGVIKTVRAITGLGLKEAKDLVEKAPVTVKEAVSKAESDDFKKQLEEAGASVEIK